MASQTVLEAVSFAARSRLPTSVTARQRAALVYRVLHLLGMTDMAGQQIGRVGGLNPEERKYAIKYSVLLFYSSVWSINHSKPEQEVDDRCGIGLQSVGAIP